jgi:hypothetical protein
LIERTAKYVDTQQGTIMVYYKKMGKKEDRLIEQYFQEIRLNGHPFNPQNAYKYSPLSFSDLLRLLRGIEGKTKNTPEMQLANLCLYPLARSKEKPDNLALYCHERTQTPSRLSPSPRANSFSRNQILLL